MTLILLDEVRKGYNKNKIIERYMDWANDDNYFMGKNTRQIFKNIKTVKGCKNRINKKQIEKIENKTQSNGALMRCTPLSLSTKENVIYDCSLTNSHSVCIDVNLYYINLIRKYLNFTPHDNTYSEEILNIVTKAKNKVNLDISGKDKGWCLYGLYCAVYCDEHFSDYKTAIDWVILKGGDTDTNACIAGGLLSAKTEKGDLRRDNFYSLENIDNMCSKFVE